MESAVKAWGEAVASGRGVATTCSRRLGLGRAVARATFTPTNTSTASRPTHKANSSHLLSLSSASSPSPFSLISATSTPRPPLPPLESCLTFASPSYCFFSSGLYFVSFYFFQLGPKRRRFGPKKKKTNFHPLHPAIGGRPPPLASLNPPLPHSPLTRLMPLFIMKIV